MTTSTPAKRLKTRTARQRAARHNAEATTQRGAIYGRLSLFDDDTTSPERQIEDCEANPRIRRSRYCRDHDLYEDFDSKSGFNEDVRRPGYENLFASLSLYDFVVVYRLDRLARRVKELLRFLEEAERHNVVLISATEGIDTSNEMGRFFVKLVGIFAEMESDNIGKRVAGAQDWMTRNGRWRGGPFAFGFRPESSHKPGSAKEATGTYYRHEPNEVKHLMAGIERVFAGGSLSGIAEQWTAAGLPTAKDHYRRDGWEKRKAKAEAAGRPFTDPEPAPTKRWSVGGVTYVLTNPLLVGHGRFGEDLVRDDKGKPIIVVEPLLDPDTFTELCLLVENRGQGGAGIQRGEQSRLAGIATCGLCGEPLVSSTDNYRCDRKLPAPGEERCPGLSIKKADLDAYVRGWLEEQLTDTRWRAALKAMEIVEPTRAPDPSVARRQEISETLARLRGDREAGLYNGPEDEARYRADVLRLKGEFDELASHTAPANMSLASLLRKYDSFAALLDEQNIDAERRFLKAALGELSIAKGSPGGTVEARRARLIARVTLRLTEALAGPEPRPARTRRSAR